MSEAWITHTFEILTMLLVAFLFGLLLGYILWYKWRRMYIDLQSEHERLSSMHRNLEKDHASLRYRAEEADKKNKEQSQKIMSLDGDISILKNKLAKCEEEKVDENSGAAYGSGKTTPEPDDLKKIEGIGPKIEQLCNGIGVYTWKQLSETSVDTLQKMLDDAGPRYKIAVPDTWPTQAKMAAEGDWEKLKEYQDYLDGGREPS